MTRCLLLTQRAEIGAELVLQDNRDVDVGQNAEALALQSTTLVIACSKGTFTILEK